jgi:hypothetical protein
MVMACVSYAAHRIVGSFGVAGGLATIAAMYVGALCYDQGEQPHHVFWKAVCWIRGYAAVPFDQLKKIRRKSRRH